MARDEATLLRQGWPEPAAGAYPPAHAFHASGTHRDAWEGHSLRGLIPPWLQTAVGRRNPLTGKAFSETLVRFSFFQNGEEV